MTKLNLSALTNTGDENNTPAIQTEQEKTELLQDGNTSSTHSGSIDIQTESITIAEQETSSETQEQKQDQTKKEKANPEELFLNYESEMNKVDFNPKELLNKKLGPIASLKYSKIAIASTVFVFLCIISFSIYIFVSTKDIASSTKASSIEGSLPPIQQTETATIEDSVETEETENTNRLEKELEVGGYTYEYIEITPENGNTTYEYNEKAYASFDALMQELEQKSEKIKNEEVLTQEEVVEIAGETFSAQKIETESGVFEYEYKGYVYTTIRRLRNGIKKMIIIENAIKKRKIEK